MFTAGLLLATPAGALPPAKLTDRITDNTGALTDSGRAAVSSAIDRLYRERHIQLWVVYVDNFSRFKPENWADRTRDATGMGDHDALLAIATNTKSYTFTAPGVPANELNTLRSNKIEPAVSAKDWSGAATATADGLNTSTSTPSRNWLPIAIGIGIGVLLLVVVVILFLRARRRRRGSLPIDTDPGQVNIGGATLPLDQALSRADARVRQIGDYVARHKRSIGAEAKAQFDEAKKHLAAAHAKKATDQEAIAQANAASTLAAQAQELANADVLAAHNAPQRRRSQSGR